MASYRQATCSTCPVHMMFSRQKKGLPLLQSSLLLFFLPLLLVPYLWL